MCRLGIDPDNDEMGQRVKNAVTFLSGTQAKGMLFEDDHFPPERRTR